MKYIDVLLAAIAGQLISFLIVDFLQPIIPWHLVAALFIIVPMGCVGALFFTYRLAAKSLTFLQAVKHLLVGAAATVIDLKIFELLLWASHNVFLSGSVTIKGVSFFISILVKYAGNKYWAFQKHELSNIVFEALQFLGVTSVALALDVISFYYLTKVIGPQFSLTPMLWTKASVILAAVIAAIWNFLGYKFLVFKK